MDKGGAAPCRAVDQIVLARLSVGFVETFRVAVHGYLVAHLGRWQLNVQLGRWLAPFDPSNVPAIVKALWCGSKLNAYALDPRTVAVSVPPISGGTEGRDCPACQEVGLGGESRRVLSGRRPANRLRAPRRGSDAAVQEATDAAVQEIERLVKAKLAKLGT